MHKVFSILLFSLLFFSCNQNRAFFEFQTVSEAGWNKDSALVFNVQIDDTLKHYDVLLNVRNGGEYPYQNLWLFVNRTGPDSMILNDTIECYLAEPAGKWKGSGIGSVYEISVLYLQNTNFSKKGIYKYTIKQGMRENKLPGISDIGLKIESK